MKMKVLLVIIFLFLIILIIYCMNTKKDDKRYEWSPWCSAPKEFDVYTHYFWVKYGNDKAVGMGREMFDSGIDESYAHEAGTVRNEIPTGFHVVYVATQEQKAYEADVNFTREELDILRNRFETGYQGYEGRDYFSSFCICILPGGHLRFLLRGEEQKRRETLDFDYYAKETHILDDGFSLGGFAHYRNLKEYFDLSLHVGEDLDSIKKEYGEQEYITIKYLREGNFPMHIWDKYFNRFNYRTVVSFENENAVCTSSVTSYTNTERVMIIYEHNPSNYIENPSYIKDLNFSWDVDENSFEAFLYFNEDEVFEVFDKAFGTDRKNKGELCINVCKYNNLIDINLKVDDKVYPIEKTQIDIIKIDPETRDREMFYENYEGPDHQQFLGYRDYKPKSAYIESAE